MTRPIYVPLEKDGVRRIVRPGTPFYWCDFHGCFVVDESQVLYEEHTLPGEAHAFTEPVGPDEVVLIKGQCVGSSEQMLARTNAAFELMPTPWLRFIPKRITPSWRFELEVAAIAFAGGAALIGFVWIAWLLAMGAEGL